MDLEKAWKLVDFYLGHIVSHTQRLKKSAETITSKEKVTEISLAESELTEALRLSRSADSRIRGLFAGLQD